MHWLGPLLKMESRVESDEGRHRVYYRLPVGTERVEMAPLLGRQLEMEYRDEILCIHCGRKTSKSFAQGYCYPCFTTLPQTDACILRPELCEAHLGISRDMAWSEKNCLQEHYVYLALSSGLKVGVTRKSQVPTRWIDQGATQAIILARTPNRHTAGTIEVDLKGHLSDKTNWRHMLTNVLDDSIDLVAARDQAAALIPPEYHDFLVWEDRTYEFQYPVLNYPEKVKSLNLDKDPRFRGELMGMKGQYLIFRSGHVINIRKYGGYVMKISVTD